MACSRSACRRSPHLDRWPALTPKNLPVVRQRVGLLFQDPDDQLISARFSRMLLLVRGNSALHKIPCAHASSIAFNWSGCTGFEDRNLIVLATGKNDGCVWRVCWPANHRFWCSMNPPVISTREAAANSKLCSNPCPGAKIIATHDLELVVDLCSRALILDEGRLVAHGSAIPLLSDESLMLAHGLEKPHSLLHLHPHG